jgi:hypothetical protein
MLKSRFAAVSCAVAVAGLFAASVAQGNVSGKNYLTFSAPFALPGVALPAGSYIFEVVVPGSYDVVRVTKRDDVRVHVTAFTRRIDRPSGLAANSQIVFGEVSAGTTPPVRAWFPIGESVGHEFLYAADSPQLRSRGSY